MKCACHYSPRETSDTKEAFYVQLNVLLEWLSNGEFAIAMGDIICLDNTLLRHFMGGMIWEP